MAGPGDHGGWRRPVVELELERPEHGAPSTGAHLHELLQIPRLVASPAAGVDFAVTLEGGYYWRLVTLSALYTASAAVANRVASLQFQDGDSNVFGGWTAPVAITAGQAIQLTWAVAGGLSTVPAGGPMTMTIPDRFLQGGWKIAANTAAKDVGDQWSKIFALFERVGGSQAHNLPFGG